MIDIVIRSIPHGDQTYETVGNYAVDANGGWTITVSGLSDWRREVCVAVHELIEMALCQRRAIPMGDIDDFDKLFEMERGRGTHSLDAEPGDDPRAPYRREHFFATSIERLVAAELGVDWAAYEKEIGELVWP